MRDVTSSRRLLGKSIFHQNDVSTTSNDPTHHLVHRSVEAAPAKVLTLLQIEGVSPQPASKFKRSTDGSRPPLQYGHGGHGPAELAATAPPGRQAFHGVSWRLTTFHGKFTPWRVRPAARPAERSAAIYGFPFTARAWSSPAAGATIPKPGARHGPRHGLG